MSYKMSRKGAYYYKKYENQFRARYWGSLAILTIIWLLVIIGIYGYQEIDSRIKVAFASEKMVTSNNIQITKLEQQNQDLKTTLNREFSVSTDNTTKSIVEYYLQKYFGPQAPIAERIFTCESGLRPGVTSKPNTNGTVDSGVPQINSVHATKFEDMYGIPLSIGSHDIDLSIKYAKYLYDSWGGNFNAWSCSRIVNK